MINLINIELNKNPLNVLLSHVYDNFIILGFSTIKVFTKISSITLIILISA